MAASPHATHTFVLTSLARSGFLDGDDNAAAWHHAQRVCCLWRDVIRGVVHAHHTLLVTHEHCARHLIPRRAERPERLRFVMDRLLDKLPRISVSEHVAPATIEQLTRFHSEVHVDSLLQLAAKIERSMAALDALEMQQGFVSPRATNSVSKMNGFHVDPHAAPMSPSSSYFNKRPDKPKSKAAYYAQFEFIDIDDDTIMMRHTLDAARLAAGAVCHAIDAVMAPGPCSSSAAQNAFCVVRPPGHHAEPKKSMGFCFFNNIGIGAFHAIDAHGLERVAIIDFDVHHGNGTQRHVEDEPRLLYVSLHQSPWFPHTGFAREKGKHDNIVNIPLPARSSGAVYRQRFLDTVWPRVAAFQPQLILISAGFDGHANDPLSDMKLQASDFYWITHEIVAMAWHCCQGRVVSVLEGGYHASALADSTEQHVRALLHGSVPHSHHPAEARGRSTGTHKLL